MRRSGRIVELVLRALQKEVKPGVTTLELDTLAADMIKAHGATASFLHYRGYPYSICASVNEQVVHGFPGKRKLVAGDILSIDVGVLLDGWHGDAARTFFVGEVPEEVKRLVRETRACFFAGLKQARQGNRLYDISAAVEAHAKQHGYGVVRELVGHGIGRNMHEPPDVPNFTAPNRGRGLRLQAGMVIAVEPMINLGCAAVRTLEDGWTVVTKDGRPSAHYENTIAITDGDAQLLTLTEPEEGPEVQYG